MYGEDLDWCYRVGKAGFRVYYVHSTSIIHYKGESTRRSSINEIRVFYGAMQVFVAKHFGESLLLKAVLTVGISLREILARVNRVSHQVLVASIDFLLVDLAVFLSAWLYYSDPLHFPDRASGIVWFAPSIFVVGAIFRLGGYTSYRDSLTRALSGTIIGYLLISAAVFFFKNLAYSRFMVMISGLICTVLIGGWRIVIRRPGHVIGRKSLFGSPTLIVGIGSSACEVLKKLRSRVHDGYQVVGFIDTTNTHVGEMIEGVEVVGSVENMAKVIADRSISEVIFSTDSLSYGQMLSIIVKGRTSGVNYRMVPASLEAIVGKTRVDRLDSLALVEMEYKLHLPSHRFLKRTMDLCVAFAGSVTLYPAVRLLNLHGRFPDAVRALPSVLRGRMSLIGLPSDRDGDLAADLVRQEGNADLGPLGLTGLIQVNERPDSTMEERGRYALYYATNHSFALDVEILAKSFMR
jgi:lipopolysaccharide/colanic/teichoic acid biosynthesis glycosyltransferase